MDICVAAASAALSGYYPSNAAVQADAGVQAWVAALLSPTGANMRRINAKNAVTTRAELFDLAGYMLFLSVAHGATHLQDYAVMMLSQVGEGRYTQHIGGASGGHGVTTGGESN